MTPAPRPDTECAALRAECDDAYDRYLLIHGRGRGARFAEREAARLAYLAAHDRWAVAWYGGDGSPWDRKRGAS